MKTFVLLCVFVTLAAACEKTTLGQCAAGEHSLTVSVASNFDASAVESSTQRVYTVAADAESVDVSNVVFDFADVAVEACKAQKKKLVVKEVNADGAVTYKSDSPIAKGSEQQFCFEVPVDAPEPKINVKGCTVQATDVDVCSPTTATTTAATEPATTAATEPTTTTATEPTTTAATEPATTAATEPTTTAATEPATTAATEPATTAATEPATTQTEATTTKTEATTTHTEATTTKTEATTTAATEPATTQTEATGCPPEFSNVPCDSGSKTLQVAVTAATTEHTDGKSRFEFTVAATADSVDISHSTFAFEKGTVVYTCPDERGRRVKLVAAKDGSYKDGTLNGVGLGTVKAGADRTVCFEVDEPDVERPNVWIKGCTAFAENLDVRQCTTTSPPTTATTATEATTKATTKATEATTAATEPTTNAQTTAATEATTKATTATESTQPASSSSTEAQTTAATQAPTTKAETTTTEAPTTTTVAQCCESSFEVSVTQDPMSVMPILSKREELPADDSTTLAATVCAPCAVEASAAPTTTEAAAEATTTEAAAEATTTEAAAEATTTTQAADVVEETDASEETNNDANDETNDNAVEETDASEETDGDESTSDGEEIKVDVTNDDSSAIAKFEQSLSEASSKAESSAKALVEIQLEAGEDVDAVAQRLLEQLRKIKGFLKLKYTDAAGEIEEFLGDVQKRSAEQNAQMTAYFGDASSAQTAQSQIASTPGVASATVTENDNSGSKNNTTLIIGVSVAAGVLVLVVVVAAAVFAHQKRRANRRDVWTQFDSTNEKSSLAALPSQNPHADMA